MNQKWIIAIIIIVLILLLPGTSVFANNKKATNDDYTHTIFAEFATATYCHACKYAHAALKNVYTSGQYPFYYVSLIGDVNPIAYDRVKNDYNIYGYPTVFFDGGYEIILGGGTNNAAQYISSINSCGDREVSDIDIVLDVSWLGNTEMKINVLVVNNEDSRYDGHIRVYITEIVSSMGWDDTAGYPYTFAFLDYAFDESISIAGGDVWSNSITWTGSDHNYSNITKDNIMIIAAVFNDERHPGYANPPWQNPFDAYYVDDAIVATPNGNTKPLLKIDTITGGLFKVNVVIKNIGLANATNVNWSIVLDGGLILSGKEKTGVIPNIPVGEEVIISSGLILGFGKTMVTVNAELPDGSSDIKDADALVLLFFIKMIKGEA